MITRIIAFKPFLSKDYHEEDTPPGDSTVEEELAKWMTRAIPSIAHATGSCPVEKVEQYLEGNPEDFELAVNAAYQFIQTEKMTHYIQAIELGAAKYSLSITDGSNRSAGVNLEVEAFKAGVGTAVDRSKESSNKISHDHMIGNIDTVSKNHGEVAVGIILRPVFTLVTKKAIRHVLQKASLYYLNRESKL